jgi:fumarate hydratase class I
VGGEEHRLEPPAQIELYADTAAGHETTYKFLFMAKGGGSANKSYLYQETKAS